MTFILSHIMHGKIYYFFSIFIHSSSVKQCWMLIQWAIGVELINTTFTKSGKTFETGLLSPSPLYPNCLDWQMIEVTEIKVDESCSQTRICLQSILVKFELQNCLIDIWYWLLIQTTSCVHTFFFLKNLFTKINN